MTRQPSCKLHEMQNQIRYSEISCCLCLVFGGRHLGTLDDHRPVLGKTDKAYIQGARLSKDHIDCRLRNFCLLANILIGN
ncbi:hypothetical protein T4E_1881 [Trichinella pseudospiralis]|uniref:Uncharacterized protein n=1 Tax=Trichinella pseudospiralis TaxID=6337 RepID=A0A0V0XP77_TRIPS|nr:hypothetical protein T4E_6819 [Trichinella pseudospiralis]KRX89701.1 hypothetical protein T4E_1881 [Trichinella pseudospiralis]